MNPSLRKAGKSETGNTPKQTAFFIHESLKNGWDTKRKSRSRWLCIYFTQEFDRIDATRQTAVFQRLARRRRPTAGYPGESLPGRGTILE
ncbi:conjugative transfer protein TrbE [Desulfovibrio ferrophilus]|uniref:Conjugative transfer protein TrbE n=1 Tax=Desulfovibrio ferrophilus TaxID=241368 RepID=A0A2Z6B3I1_9BACT|nr:conjugative transfer protein TrbE [Desulfovibrio ferrophilus]